MTSYEQTLTARTERRRLEKQWRLAEQRKLLKSQTWLGVLYGVVIGTGFAWAQVLYTTHDGYTPAMLPSAASVLVGIAALALLLSNQRPRFDALAGVGAEDA
ncbi:hypothetical protein ACPPVW_18365 [Leifsonia sp. McL0607]|uniref:hypothetical protein n=1 Tax=Leifsonia sp. McL0607 TaxID=3415672 RepID=UPI003CFAEE17